MTTSDSRVIALPHAIPPESAICDASLDHERFESGFDDASAHLASLPRAWASHHASTMLADGRIPDEKEAYERGYRAALYGYLRQPRKK
ncbi:MULTISPECIES: hypothetical protein [unclassified Gordonia (in: high G+C Gram-positive bacteria)]|uniref:hypothetical protein n=1 Tax=unclassified Gordonia (in: high G+C Gram-positive bacteria) TaxID=2657482 RepID=UPI001F0F63FA|nr:hypothetical protein [Gordonia sp. ABSL49_1]MCH5645600.1 hypothetical protein [Gordonia sp. ABSL49_1]